MNNNTMFVYFSGLLSKEVYDVDGKKAGALYDLSVGLGEPYPKVSELVVRTNGLRTKFGVTIWSNVQGANEVIKLKVPLSGLAYTKTPPAFDFTLREDILDKQVVDTLNHKVIRVNDVHLLCVENDLRIAHVDIGIRGVVRRLGWERIADFLVRHFAPQSRYLSREDFVSWKAVMPLSIHPTQKTIRLNVTHAELLKIPAGDLSEIIADLDSNERLALFRSIDKATQMRLLEALDVKLILSILDGLDTKEVAALIEGLSPDKAADILEDLNRGRMKDILSFMETNRARRLSVLLGYSSDSAGGIMTTEFLSVSDEMTVEKAFEKIKGETSTSKDIYYCYVLDKDKKLVGTTSLRRLIGARPGDNVLSAAFPKTLFVRLDDSVKEVAYLMDKYKCSSLPVLDSEKRLQGVITNEEIISHILPIAWRRRPRRKAP